MITYLAFSLSNRKFICPIGCCRNTEVVRPRRKPLQSNLSERDVAVCLRLKEAREQLGMSQEEFARKAGLTRGALGNYELCRTPLRCGLALRVCRAFIISEEWLATGTFTAIIAAAPNLEAKLLSKDSNLARIFSRQCMDLASEAISQEIQHTALFSDAYDEFLAPVYARLCRETFPDLRLKQGLLGPPSRLVAVLDAYMQRWLYALAICCNAS